MPPTADVLDSRYFHVFKTGPLTVIGFEGKYLADSSRIAECRDSLLNLVDNHLCEMLVVDLMDVELVSSWILGVLASVHQQGVEVHVYHPSAEIRGVLDVTRLNELMTVRQGLG